MVGQSSGRPGVRVKVFLEKGRKPRKRLRDPELPRTLEANGGDGTFHKEPPESHLRKGQRKSLPGYRQGGNYRPRQPNFSHEP